MPFWVQVSGKSAGWRAAAGPTKCSSVKLRSSGSVALARLPPPVEMANRNGAGIHPGVVEVELGVVVDDHARAPDTLAEALEVVEDGLVVMPEPVMGLPVPFDQGVPG